MKQSVTTDAAPEAPALLSQAIIANGFIFVAGQVHNTPDGKLVEGSVEAKFSQIMANITAVLNAADGELNDVVKVTIYVTEMSVMPELNSAYQRYFNKPLPAREAVCVQALPLGATIEVSVIAAKGQ